MLRGQRSDNKDKDAETWPLSLSSYPAGYATSPDRGSQVRPLFPEAVIPSTFSKVTCTDTQVGFYGFDHRDVEVASGLTEG